jgi:hypothetical protein
MSLRTVCAAAVAAAVLVAVPACKKKKPSTESDPAPANPQPNTTPGPGAPNTPPHSTGTVAQSSDPNAPRPPIFGLSDPRTAAMREEAQRHLVQIGLALHNYHDTNNAFPTAIVDKNGKPLLSWRVAILPFIEQDGLYKQFKLDEPWDSPANKALVTKMPKQFAPPRFDTNGYTFLRGFSGPGTWLPPAVGPRPQKIGMFNITDGTSNTILVAEAAEAVVWTKPDEMAFTPNGPVPAVGGVFATGTHALLADGSVKFLRKGFDPVMLARAIQIADGNIVNWD